MLRRLSALLVLTLIASASAFWWVTRQPLPLPEKSHVRVTIETSDESDDERRAWLKLSEQSLMKAWDNTDDNVFNELLSK